MTLRPRFASAIAAVGLLLVAAWPARAADPEIDKFKSEIDAFLAGIGSDTNGAVRWLGSDPYEVKRDGGALVAVIDHPRFALQTPEGRRLALDRVEIRRTGEEDGGKLIDLAVKLPSAAMIDGGPDGPIRITLKEATMQGVVEAATGRSRDMSLAAAGGRIEQPKAGDWLAFGPLSLTSKLVGEAGGGWSAPFQFQLAKIEFFSAEDNAPVGGTIDRVYASGKSAGPDLAAFNKMRDALDALKKDTEAPEARLAGLQALLPSMPAVFASLRGDIGVEGLTVRAGGQPLVTLAKAELASAVTGLNGEEAALRLTLRQDGLTVAPSLLEPDKVPHRIIVDFGIEHVGTKALANLVEAAVAMEGDGAHKPQALQQMMGAAAMLDPTYRIYDAAVDTQDVGIDLTGEAKGSPLSPKGYAATADLQVRGLDVVPRLAADPLVEEYLPVLKEMAVAGKGPDGAPLARFHLASVPGKLLTVNGNDVGTWLAGGETQGGGPRLLKPSIPPQKGGDVRAVQRALAAAHVAVEQNGVYSGATAAAVAHFQKQNGLNVDGVVDAATRKRLDLAEPPRRRGRN